MFGTNKVVNPHAFDEALPHTLMVTTIFPTLQGEGPFTGVPSTFIRLSRCSLSCSFCDTWFDSGEVMTFSDILTKARQVWQEWRKKNAPAHFYLADNPMLVITGGEPTLQSNLSAFCEYATMAGYRIQIESNGMFYRELVWPTHLVISPKCNEQTREYIKPNDKMLDRADSLKFVVSADEPGYTDLPDFAQRWLLRKASKGGQIFISPMNCYKTKPDEVKGSMDERMKGELISFWEPDRLDMERNQHNHEHAALLAMRYGVRLSLQTHLLASLP